MYLHTNEHFTFTLKVHICYPRCERALHGCTTLSTGSINKRFLFLNQNKTNCVLDSIEIFNSFDRPLDDNTSRF